MTGPVSRSRATRSLKIVQVGDELQLRTLAVELLVELRPHLDIPRARGFVQEAMTRGYGIMLGPDEKGTASALADFRTLTTGRGSVLLLEDLVVTQSARGAGDQPRCAE